MNTKRSVTAFDKLAVNLKHYNIPFEYVKKFDGYIIKYPSIENEKVSIAFHKYSYGFDANLMEVMGLCTTIDLEKELDVLGYMTPYNIFIRLLKYHRSHKGFCNDSFN